MRENRILVSHDEFISRYGEYLLIYALDAVKYNFMEVVRQLRIEEEVEQFFGKTLDKYTALDQFEIIISDIISGTPVEKYEEMLVKMHSTFVFPDHLLIVNTGSTEKEKLDAIQEIIAGRIPCNFSYWKSKPGLPDAEEQIKSVAGDFAGNKDGLYCFVLLHKDDYPFLGHGEVVKAFDEASPLKLPG